MTDSGFTPLRPQSSHKTSRLWIPLLILAVAAVALIHTWFFWDIYRQQKIIRTGMVGIFTGLLLLIWFLFLSRFSRKIRLASFAVLLVSLCLVLSLFRIKGVSGDLVPILELRGAKYVSIKPSPESAASINARFKLKSSYPQFLGPTRNAHVPELKLATNWDATPPRLLWRHAIGPAWTGFVVQDQYAVTQEQAGESELTSCYELLSGKLLWSSSNPAHYNTTIAGEGPRANPAISDGKVYSIGATGKLNCLELLSGKLLWSIDLIKDNDSQLGEWGYAGSPLVQDGKVIAAAGGSNNRSLVAYSTVDGHFLWGGGTARTSYSSPVSATIGGVPQILLFDDKGVDSYSAESGKPLWSYPWPGGHPHVMIPIVAGNNRILVGSGYGTGSELIEVHVNGGNWQARRIWKSVRLKPKFTNVVIHHGFIYGLDDGMMACIDAENGELKWKEGRYGHGQEILSGDLLLVMCEDGRVLLMKPDPSASLVLASFQALKGKTWNPPALADNYLVVRNDVEAACYELPLIKASSQLAN